MYQALLRRWYTHPMWNELLRVMSQWILGRARVVRLKGGRLYYNGLMCQSKVTFNYYTILQQPHPCVWTCNWDAECASNEARKQILSKGAKLFAILPGNAGSGVEDDAAWEFVDDKNPQKHRQEVHLQTWDIPWSPEQFVHSAVKAGRPMLPQACLPASERTGAQVPHHLNSWPSTASHKQGQALDGKSKAVGGA